MPRVRSMMSDSEKLADYLEKQKRKLRVEFGGAIGRIKGARGLADYEIAKRAGFAQSTFSVRLKTPEKFSLEEIFRLSRQFPEIRESLIKAL